MTESPEQRLAADAPRGPAPIDLPAPIAEFSNEPPLSGARVHVLLFGDAPIDAQLVAVDALAEQLVVTQSRDVRHVIAFAQLRALIVRPFPWLAGSSALLPERLSIQLEYRDQTQQQIRVASSSSDHLGLHLISIIDGQCRRIFIPSLAILRSNTVSIDVGAGNGAAELVSTAPSIPAAVSAAAISAAPEIAPVIQAQTAQSEAQLAAVLARRLDLPLAELDGEIDPHVLDEVPAAIAREHRVLPLHFRGERLRVAMSSPTDTATLQLLQFLTGRTLIVEVAPAEALLRKIDASYGFLDEDQDLDALEASVEPSIRSDDRAQLEALFAAKPVVRLVNNIVLEAIRRNASDIHIRPGEHDVELIFRIDGELTPIRRFARTLLPAIIGRIKILGVMDITERRLPQDGQMRIREAHRATDIRISVMPSIEGESVVMRLLRATVGMKDVVDLGLSPADTQRFKDALDRSHGMFLVTGPTGSGKSTTLYAALNLVLHHNVNIITVENPVEYHIPGITQIPINADVGMTFATALRNILRHDPDVIMVGEIRDQETARIAVQSALTGHLLLSTLHTNSAVATIPRLIEMGIEGYLLRATLIAVLAQRLVRHTCSECRVADDVDPHMRELLVVSPSERFVRGAGCSACAGTGIRGRRMTYEYLQITPSLRHLLEAGVDETSIQEQALRDGMVPLTQHAVGLARAGEISLHEAYATRLE